MVTSTGTPIGKVTLGCDTQLSRQEFEALGVLSGWLANVLTAFRDRDKAASEKEHWIEKAAELSMSQMAHNMNTQFASFGLLLERYRRKEKAVAEIRGLNEEFASDYARLSAVARDAKKRLGAVHISPETLSIATIMREVLTANLRHTQWHLAGDMTLQVDADRTLLAEAFSELVDNARKAKQPAEDLQLTVSLSGVGDSIVVRVGDNGPGIQGQYKNRIFENFFHLHNVTNTEGLGLGLNRVKRVIEAHGGSIRETGIFREGASFEIRLPRKVAVVEPANV